MRTKVTAGGSGAGNLGNTSAWFTVRASDSSREWLFQRKANDQTWTISRSKSGFIVGGDATTPSTSTDATALFSAASAFTATPGRLFISADDADGYGWRLMCLPVGGGNVLTLLLDVPLDSPDPSDTDPYLWVGYYNSTGLGVYSASSFNNVTAAGLVYKRFGASSNQRAAFVTLSVSSSANVAPPEGAQGGALQHVGRAPTRAAGDAQRSALLKKLMRDLEAAVAAEQYERAARLRDAIKDLRPQPAGGEPA